MPRRKDGSLALGIYLPQIRKHLTFSGEEFKKHVQQAGGEVNTTVTFLKDGSKSATPELEWDESTSQRIYPLPDCEFVKDDVIKNINKCNYGLMLKYFIR